MVNQAATPTDIISLSSQARNPQAGRPKYEHQAYPVRWDENGKPDLYYWYFIQYGLTGGLNKTYADYNYEWDRSLSSTLWHEEGVLCLPPFTTTAATPDPAGSLAGMHFVQEFNDVIIACGSTNDACLFHATSSTDPTLVALTGAGAAQPGSAFTFAESAIANGVTTVRSVILGKAGGAPVRIASVTTTVAATGHADLNPSYGMWEYNDIRGFLADNGIYTQPISVDISTAPTAVVENVFPDGGFVAGLFVFQQGIFNGVVRVFAGIPDTDTPAGGLLTSAEKTFTIWHWNVLGADREILNFKPVLNKIKWFGITERGIMATDGERWAMHNGAYAQEMYAFEDRDANSDRVYRTRGAHIIGDDIYARVNHIAGPNGTGNTNAWSERFNADDWSWNNGSSVSAMASTGVYGVLPGGRGLPWHLETKTMYVYEDGSWRYQTYPNPGVSWFGLRKTAGSAATTGVKSATTGTFTSPNFRFPDMLSMAKTLFRVTPLGPIRSSGTPTTVPTATITIPGGQSHAFTPHGTNDVVQPWVIKPQDQNWFDLFQWSCLLTQQTGGTDATLTNLNPLPIMFEGWAEPRLEEPMPTGRHDVRGH